MADLGILQTHELTFDYSKSLVTSFEMKEFDSGLSKSLESQPAEHDNFAQPVVTYDPTSQIKTGESELTILTKVQKVITGGQFAVLYYRETKELVDIKKSDADGLAVFSNLTNDPDAYFAVVLTDLDFEAIAFDKLTAS